MARKPNLKNLSLPELQKLYEEKLAQEQKRLPKLIAKRDSLKAELEELNQQIETLGGETAATKPKRAKKAAKRAAKKRGRKTAGKRVTLPDALASILSSSKDPMSPAQLTEEIQKMKHPSAKSKSLRLQITTALSKRPEFKKVGRGQYKMKK